MSVATNGHTSLQTLPRERLIDRAGEAIARAMLDATSDDEISRLPDEFHQACLGSTGNEFLRTLGTILYRFFWSVTAAGPRVRQLSYPEQQTSHFRIAKLLRRRRQEDVPAMIKLHLGVAEG